MSGRSSTVRTVLGFVRSVLARWIPGLAKTEQLSDIYNFLEIPNLYATSGQPSAAQLALIQQAGFDLVINLAPTSMLENSVVEEAQILEGLGITYTHIPVDFQNPTDADFTAFVRAVESADAKVWVHCAANMRVSAFTYRYRTQVLGEATDTAGADLQQIWEPMGVWTDFIQRPLVERSN